MSEEQPKKPTIREKILERWQGAKEDPSFSRVTVDAKPSQPAKSNKPNSQKNSSAQD